MNLSNIFETEIKSTMDSLLALTDSHITLKNIDVSNINIKESLNISTSFSYSTINSEIYFLVEADHAYLMEYKMLGETDALKTNIDDNLLDAIKEIIANITGAISNSINAQDDEILKDVKFNVNSIDTINNTNELIKLEAIEIQLNTEDTNFQIYIVFPVILLDFFSPKDNTKLNSEPSKINNSGQQLSDIINDAELDNLKLLLHIELRLSVRLGSKEMLLKDIVKLDLGDIVELDQLVNEPLDVLVNGSKIAEGEAVVVDGKFAIKIRNIGSVKERMSYLRLGN
jgi:flagellar motor switch protein FliN/FliY